MSKMNDAYQAIVDGKHGDPFSILGPHEHDDFVSVLSWQPQAQKLDLIDQDGNLLSEMHRIHDDGLFEGQFSESVNAYRLRVTENNHTHIIEDPYRFNSLLTDFDEHLIKEGRLDDLAQKLGANPVEIDGVSGVYFSVWAPNASRVSVVGFFNHWDGRRHPMRKHPNIGIWDIFIPSLCKGDYYKFEILDNCGSLLPLKADPFARHMEQAPGNSSIVYDDNFEWQDAQWMSQRQYSSTREKPIAVYEVHLGSWKRTLDNKVLSYRELADDLVNYVTDMGFTHIELMPISEHPFDGSWGYQPVGLFSPTSRFGTPEDFKYFVDCCHQAGIGIIMDWVPAHFPRDEFGLGEFDGTHLYEHADPRLGAHPDWGTLIFNFGRPEVVNYLIANALFWVNEYHIDVLRVDAVASMLYLDYSRNEGEWIPNKEGGNENLEAVAFLRLMNEKVHAAGAMTMAEESTAWPGVSHPVYDNGLGFSFKWNMGWMNDTLSFFEEDPIHRKYHQDKITFGLHYAFNENFILPLSHDEVVHGKGSLINKMPGDEWQSFANLRLYYAFMYAHPGKKLLFMGSEFAQTKEWNHNQSLDWHLLESTQHSGVQRLVKTLNESYLNYPELYELDFSTDGFNWIDCNQEDSVIAFMRQGSEPSKQVIVVCNMTPVVRYNYRVGSPTAGTYIETVNTDDLKYGGSGVANMHKIKAEHVASHGHEYSLQLVLPPLSTLILILE